MIVGQSNRKQGKETHNDRFQSPPRLILLRPGADDTAEKVAQYDEDYGRGDQGRRPGNKETLHAVGESAQVKQSCVSNHRWDGRNLCDIRIRRVDEVRAKETYVLALRGATNPRDALWSSAPSHRTSELYAQV